VIVALEYLQEKQLITLETKKITEVYSVNKALLSSSTLPSSLYEYFVDKEEKEIKRIATLVRFFELDTCLSHNLSRYFDDQNAPVNCGHCSVCRGKVVKLSYSQEIIWPDDAAIYKNLTTLSQHMSTKNKSVLSLETMCRFLTGLTVPLFSRNKVKQLAGFGSCENIRYQEVREKVIRIMNL
jgi:ATP-dependent DNA helicase RecQ